METITVNVPAKVRYGRDKDTRLWFNIDYVEFEDGVRQAILEDEKHG